LLFVKDTAEAGINVIFDHANGKFGGITPMHSGGMS
jgi:hypothetical protein